MNEEAIYSFNIGTAYMVQSHLMNDVPFHLVMETKGWEPELPSNIVDNEKALFSFVNDTLKECKIGNEYMYLFININGSNYTYEINEDSTLYSMFSDSLENPGKPGHIIFHRPEYLSGTLNDPDEGKKHSMSMFLQNPDNENFFK